MRYCQACGYEMPDCVCERVEPRNVPRPALCFCCGLPAEDQCDNEACDLYGEAS